MEELNTFKTGSRRSTWEAPPAGGDAALVQAVVSVRVSVPPHSQGLWCRYGPGRPGEPQETDGPERRTGDLKSGRSAVRPRPWPPSLIRIRAVQGFLVRSGPGAASARC